MPEHFVDLTILLRTGSWQQLFVVIKKHCGLTLMFYSGHLNFFF
jgi:hypothetical protein